MYSVKEKLNHFRQLSSPSAAEADLALLREKSPGNSNLIRYGLAPGKNAEDILFDLLDVVTHEEIVRNRREILAAKEAEETTDNTPNGNDNPDSDGEKNPEDDNNETPVDEGEKQKDDTPKDDNLPADEKPTDETPAPEAEEAEYPNEETPTEKTEEAEQVTASEEAPAPEAEEVAISNEETTTEETPAEEEEPETEKKSTSPRKKNTQK